MFFLLNKLKKISFLFFQKNKTVSLANTYSSCDFNNYEQFLKELSPFYFEETIQYDPETLDVLIRYKNLKNK
tara:strand:- start:189 stop:404 length:216 start_codon:yes stop_codon:yes gene_type:complete